MNYYIAISGARTVSLQNNKFDQENRYYCQLVDLMSRRDPFYEQPLIEEDQSNITAQTVNTIGIIGISHNFQQSYVFPSPTFPISKSKAGNIDHHPSSKL